MRAPAIQTDWRTWLDASLFPIKIYVVAAVLWLISWRSCISLNNDYSNFDIFGILPSPAYLIARDFSTFAYFVSGGYILSAVVLMAGGVVQAIVRSWRAATWNISFAAAALVIGWFVWDYVITIDPNRIISRIL
jgi:hypothetical protein